MAFCIAEEAPTTMDRSAEESEILKPASRHPSGTFGPAEI
jgi:hypothetical protein